MDMRLINAPPRETARQSRSRAAAKQMLLRCGSSDVMAEVHASYQCAISSDGAAVTLTHGYQTDAAKLQDQLADLPRH